MGQWQITVANQTLSVRYDGQSGQGSVVRLNDGLEARFSCLECLPHLFEGLLGRRTFQAHRDQIAAQLAHVLPCCA